MATTNYCHGFWFRQSWAGPRDSAACRIAISDSTDERTWSPRLGAPGAGGPAGSSPGTSLSLTTVLRPQLSFLYLGHAPRLPTVSGTLSLMLRARPTPPPPPVLRVPATTSPSQRGRVPLTSSNSVLSCQVRLGHTATFSLHGACHYLRSLWLVCPRPTYLVGSPGSRCSDGIAGIGGGCWGDTPTEEKGRKQVWAGGVIRTWLEKSLRPSGAPEQRRPTGASRVGRNSSALGTPPCSVIVQRLPREGHDFSRKAEEDLGDASDRWLPARRDPPSQAASPFLKGDLSDVPPRLLSQASMHLLLEPGSFPVANPCALEQISVDDTGSNNIVETCFCVFWGRGGRELRFQLFSALRCFQDFKH